MKVYFLKVSLRGVSPMVWRRLRVPGTASLAMLHNCIQIINGWDDTYLNQFRIFGKDYGVYHDGGISFKDDARTVYIDDFGFDVDDKFTYEYNFFKHIMHDIRVENIKNVSMTNNTIFCISGSGMPGATKYDEMDIKLKMLKRIIKNEGKLSYEDICSFQKKLKRVIFIKKLINKELESPPSE